MLRAIPRGAFAAVLLAALPACSSGGGGGSGGGAPTYPVLVRGAPTSAQGCGDVLRPGDDFITLTLVGDEFLVREIPPAGTCDVTFAGGGALTTPSNPRGLPMEFVLRGNERCNEITEATLSDLYTNTLSTVGMGGTEVSCTLSPQGLLGAVACRVGPACSFKLVQPVVLVLFDVDAAVRAAKDG